MPWCNHHNYRNHLHIYYNKIFEKFKQKCHSVTIITTETINRLTKNYTANHVSCQDKHNIMHDN